MAAKYHIYGMGNALVDLEVLVDDPFLKRHKIEKGFMTLVEEERQDHLMKAIDDIDTTKQCGGSAANTIIGAAQLGANCFYSCKVAKDELGKFYMNDLTNNGVDTNLQPSQLKEGITGKCLVMVTDDAERTMNTFLGITSDYGVEEVDEEALTQSEYLYMEGYLITSESARKAMLKSREIAKANGIKTALTFSDPSMVKYFKEPMKEVIGDGVDLLFCNEEEAKLYTDKEELEDAVAELKKVAKKFAVTRGSAGAWLWDGENMHSVAGRVVKAVDTNGAGDMFAGAFLYGITHGFDFPKAGSLATLASSRVVSQFGPRLNTLEVDRLHHLLQEEER